MAASMGHQNHFGYSASGAPTLEWELTAFTPRLNEDLYAADGMRGTRGSQSERVVQNTRAPGFSMTMQPNAVELDTLLPLILGAAEIVDVFALAETLPTFTFSVDLGGTARWYWVSCYVDKATFSAQQGGPLELTMEVESLTFTTDATVFPTLVTSAIGPYIYSESSAGLSVSSTAYGFFSWQLAIDNMLVKDRFTNSQTRTALPSAGRSVTWTWDGPYGDTTALFGLAAAGVLSSATFTKGTRSTLFASTGVSYPREFPQVNGKAEIHLPLVGQARRVTTTQELIVTNDSV